MCLPTNHYRRWAKSVRLAAINRAYGCYFRHDYAVYAAGKYIYGYVYV